MPLPVITRVLPLHVHLAALVAFTLGLELTSEIVRPQATPVAVLVVSVGVLLLEPHPESVAAMAKVMNDRDVCMAHLEGEQAGRQYGGRSFDTA